MKRSLIIFLITYCGWLLVIFLYRAVSGGYFFNPSYLTTAIAAPLFLLAIAVVPGSLPTRILIALLLGIGAAVWIGHPMEILEPLGKAFIRLITMIVIPLVFASLLIGTASLGDIRKLGRIGAKTFGFFIFTTVLAIVIGLLLANILKPGVGMSEEAKAELLQNYQPIATEKLQTAEQKPSVVDILLDIIPANPARSLMEGNMLQIIFFAMFMGIAISLLPQEKTETVIKFFDGINEIMIRIVHIVIRLAPYGVFALVASVVGQFGLDVLKLLLKYTLVTIVGLILLNFAYPLIIRSFTHLSPMTFLKGIFPAQGVAFSTSSSSAALPVMIECAEDNLGVPNDIASFVLPLGTTINMDGTALYQGVSALFIAQVFGIHLGVLDQLTIVLTALLASIGTAGVPGVGMLMLVIVLKQVGIPLEGIALILGVERILDMFRTVVNVTGDATCAVIVAASEGKLQQLQASANTPKV